jgi:hypothetical protein
VGDVVTEAFDFLQRERLPVEKLKTTPNAVRIARCKARKTIRDKLRPLGHDLGGDA